MNTGTEARPRARDLGIAIGELPTGPLNAITDVIGVLVGQITVWHGDGELRPGRGPARTGVTVIVPHDGNLFLERVPAAYFQFNGFGKCAGIEQIDELGVLETPIALTSTLSVGRVADALISHAIATTPEIGISMSSVNPFVGECNDGWLNDIQGRHITERDVHRAIESASPGPVAEGSVGAGTGMSAFGYKGGIGTSSRTIPKMLGGWTVGALVLSNFGAKRSLLIDGVPVGRYLDEDDSIADKGSIMMIVATDAPLIDRQLGRLARRAVLGLARTGSNGGHGSGDVVLAFSTAASVRRPYASEGWTSTIEIVAEDGPGGSSAAIDALFQAAAEATEESILNALFRATTVVGRDDHR
ncbi:MAG TPA: P1 family peptidase, partial [Thermomicrobiales bacterium]|nr:P1 family peptidase [Thermomicrobiales bacterium]